MKSGTKLGPYRVLEQLGAGGMGEVWLAEDTRLGRNVAVKILPPQLAADPERLARFEREARAAAALNHPHIAAVFDIGAEADSEGVTTHFMVQEYLQGSSLRKVIERGALPLGRSLQLGIEIAEALAAAHRAGIVHRDVKPENVFVTEEGHAKVLDFGLAKLTQPDGESGDPSMSPTALGTQAGVLMGTAGYMAPEQARGENIDQRVDLFAFGCVLCEMVGGQRVFGGRTVHGVLDLILSAEPAPLLSLAGSPSELQRIVRKCLAKDAARRYQGAPDLLVDLRGLATDIEAGRAAPQGPSVRAGQKETTTFRAAFLGVLAGTIAAAIVLVTGRALLRPEGNVERQPTYLTLADPPGPHTRGLYGNYVDVALSPDGRRILYDLGTGPLFLYDLDAPGPPAAVVGTVDADAPMFSPDGKWLGYILSGSLYRLPLAGGNPARIVELGESLAGSYWARDDRILYVPGYPFPVYQATLTGESSVLAPMREGAQATGMTHPSLLPDGRVLYSAWDDDWTVEVFSPETTERRSLLEGGHRARYVPTGHLVYAQDNRLFARRFDLTSLQVSDPVQLLDDLAFEPGLGQAAYAFSENGTLAYVTGPRDLDRALIRIDADTGERTALPAPRRRYEGYLRISPEGGRLAMTILDPAGGREVWVYDLASEALVPLGRGDGWDEAPFWASDGLTVGWTSEGCHCVTRRAADGSAPAQPGVPVGDVSFLGYDSHPGGFVVGALSSDQDAGGIWTLRLDEPDSLQPFLSEHDNVALEGGAFSPDGNFLAFGSNQSGRFEIYVRPFPRPAGDADREWRVSRDGGTEARWLNDGRIAYLQGQRVVAQRVDPGPPFRVGEPELLAEGLAGAWDVAADGTYVMTLEPFAPPRLALVTGWFSELERLLPR